MCGRQGRDDVGIGERVDLGQDPHARRAHDPPEHRADLVARGGLSDVAGARSEWRWPSSRKGPVLLEDLCEAIDIRGHSRVDHIVVVAAAMRAPVHPADDCLAIGDQKLHVVDLMGGVIHRIEELRHSVAIELAGGGAAWSDCGVGDHADVKTPMARVGHSRDQVGPPDLIHLDQNAMPGGVDQCMDELEDGGVLPELNGLGVRGARERGACRRGCAGCHQAEEDAEQDKSVHRWRKLGRSVAETNPAC